MPIEVRLLAYGSIAVLIALLAFWWTFGPGVGWRYMRPYRELVAQRATEKQVIAQERRPGHTLRSKAEYREFVSGSGRKDSDHLWSGGNVFVYAADPWRDGEGMAVYVFFDRGGRACGTELACYP